jgi:hypothetical protein
MPKEEQIYANDNGYQYHNENHHIDILVHFNPLFKCVSSRLSMKWLDSPLDLLGVFLFSTAKWAHTGPLE